MLRVGKDIRKSVAWIAGLTAGVLIVCLIMVSPVIGLADSGDFGRVLGVTGLTVFNPNESHEQRYFPLCAPAFWLRRICVGRIYFHPCYSCCYSRFNRVSY